MHFALWKYWVFGIHQLVQQNPERIRIENRVFFNWIFLEVNMIEIWDISTIDKNLSKFVIHGDGLPYLRDPILYEYVFNVEQI